MHRDRWRERKKERKKERKREMRVGRAVMSEQTRSATTYQSCTFCCNVDVLNYAYASLVPAGLSSYNNSNFWSLPSFFLPFIRAFIIYNVECTFNELYT